MAELGTLMAVTKGLLSPQNPGEWELGLRAKAVLKTLGD